MVAGPEFARRVLDRFLADIHTRVDDNIDLERYPGGWAGMAPSLVAQSKSTFDLLLRHADQFAVAHDLLADEASRALYLDLIAYRLAGPLHVRLAANRPEHWAARRLAEASVRGPAGPEICRAFGPLQRCELDFMGRGVQLDGTAQNVAWPFLIRQYFFERGRVRIGPEPGDVAIDGGACVGDTMLAFAAAVGETGMVHAFDPCAGHLALCLHNLALNPWARAEVHGFGLADHDRNAPPVPIAGISPGVTLRNAGDLAVPLRRLDTLVDSGAVNRVDFIKLDVEGSEQAALAGAAGAIRRFRPRLAVSLYHRLEDFFEIPAFLRDMACGYRLYLDHYTVFSDETILYAVA